MKSADFFEKALTAAVAAIPANTKRHEARRLLHAVCYCIAQGESDQGYVRNALGYDSDMPSTEKDGATFIDKKTLFGKIWQKALSEVRLRVANATANAIWKKTFKGGNLQGVVMHYAVACERNAENVKSVPPKVIAANLKSAGYKAGKNNMFTVPVKEFLLIAINPYFSTQAVDDKGKPKFGGKDNKEPVWQIRPSDLHAEFQKDLQERLAKYTELRTERLGELVDVVDDMGIDW